MHLCPGVPQVYVSSKGWTSKKTSPKVSNQSFIFPVWFENTWYVLYYCLSSFCAVFLELWGVTFSLHQILIFLFLILILSFAEPKILGSKANSEVSSIILSCCYQMFCNDCTIYFAWVDIFLRTVIWLLNCFDAWILLYKSASKVSSGFF